MTRQFEKFSRSLSRMYVYYSTLLIGIMLLGLPAYPQQEAKEDSIRLIIDTTVNIESRITQYIELVELFTYTDSSKAIKYANEIVSLSREVNLPNSEIDAKNLIAWEYLIFGNYHKADSLFRFCLKMANEINHEMGLADAYNGLGILAREQGNYSLALDYLFRSLRVNEKIQDSLSMSSRFNNIGTIYSIQGDYVEALNYFKKALDINLESKDRKRVAAALNNIGVLHWRMDDRDMALEYYNKSLSIRKEINDVIGIAESFINIAEIHREKGKLNESLNFLNDALRLSKEIDDPSSLSYVYLGLGQTYMGKGLFKEARENFKLCISISEEIGYIAMVRDASEEMANLEKRVGNFREAFNYLSIFKILSDSLNNQETIKKIAKLEVNYLFEQERDSLEYAYEKERVKLEAELKYGKIRQTATFIVSGLLLVLLAGVTLYYRSKQKANNRLAKLNDEIQEKNEALSSANKHLNNLNNTKSRLFSIISHDLRGPMNSLLGFNTLILQHLERKYDIVDDPKMKKYSGHLKIAADAVLHLLDNLMQWARKEENVITHHPENLWLSEIMDEALEASILQAETKGISLNVTVGQELIVFADRNSLLTIIRNLVGNALKFTAEGGTITVSSRHIAEKVIIEVTDTGIGMPASKLEDLYSIDEEKITAGTSGEKGTGLGLNIVHDFVIINNGDISVKSEEGVGTSFQLSFPAATT